MGEEKTWKVESEKATINLKERTRKLNSKIYEKKIVEVEGRTHQKSNINK